LFRTDTHLNGSLPDHGFSLEGHGVVRCMSFSYAAHGTSSPSRPPSIENMNYEGRACCRGKKSPARVEVQAAPNYNE